MAPESSGTPRARFCSKLCTSLSVEILGSTEEVETRKTPCPEPCVTCVRPWRPHTSCTLAGEVTRTNLFCPQSDMLVHKTKPQKILASTLDLLPNEGCPLLRKDLPSPNASDIAGLLLNGRISRFLRAAFCSIPSVIRKIFPWQFAVLSRIAL